MVLMTTLGQATATARARVSVKGAAALVADPGGLTIEAAPTEASLANPKVELRVANTGGGPVRSVKIEVDAPPGVSVVIEPSTIALLAAGASMLTRITIHGSPENSPAALVMRATGRSEVGETAAVTSIQLVQPNPVASLSLVGNTRLTDVAPADLVAVVGNLAQVPINVLVRATAGGQTVRLAREGSDVTQSTPGAPVIITVPARQSAVVLVQVEAHRPLRRGAVGLVVIAAARSNASTQLTEITSTRQLDVALSADILPGMIGIGSVLIIPGLVAIWAFLSVWYLDRRRLGLAMSGIGSQIWDNKLWLLAAAAVSLLAAALYSAAGFADLLDAYTLSDIAILTAATGLAGALTSAMMVWIHRRRFPAITPTSTEFLVLKAVNHRKPTGLTRRVYRTSDGKRGLFVHKDWGAFVLTPPIEYTEIEGMKKAERNDSLQEAVDRIGVMEDHLRFMRSEGNDYVDGPCAVREASPSGWEKILHYAQEFLSEGRPAGVAITAPPAGREATPPRSDAALPPPPHQVAARKMGLGSRLLPAPGSARHRIGHSVTRMQLAW